MYDTERNKVAVTYIQAIHKKKKDETITKYGILYITLNALLSGYEVRMQSRCLFQIKTPLNVNVDLNVWFGQSFGSMDIWFGQRQILGLLSLKF